MLTADDVARNAVVSDVLRLIHVPKTASPDRILCEPLVDAFRLITQSGSKGAAHDELVARLGQHLDRFNTIVSPSTSALPLAALVASALTIPMVYLRSKRKVHGRQRQIEGELKEGARALLLFDRMPDAEAVATSIEVIESHGATVTICAAVLADDLTSIQRALDQRGIEVWSLATSQQVTAARDRQLDTERVQSRPGDHSDTPYTPPVICEEASAPRRSADDVAHALLDIGAVIVRSSEPFRYASGLLSPIYTDNRLLMSNPGAWQVVIDCFADTVGGLLGSDATTALAGAPTAGIPHATRIGDLLHRPVVYVEPGDSSSTVYGSLEGIKRAIIVEDLVTTGRSVMEFATALHQHDIGVDWCVAIFTYDPERAVRVFEQQGMQFAVLCDLATLLDVAVRESYITEGDRDAVVDWLRDPDAWTRRAEERLASTGAS